MTEEVKESDKKVIEDDDLDAYLDKKECEIDKMRWKEDYEDGIKEDEKEEEEEEEERIMCFPNTGGHVGIDLGSKGSVKTTLEEARQLFAKKKGIPVDSFNFVHKGSLLPTSDNSKTLQVLGVTPNTFLIVEITNKTK